MKVDSHQHFWKYSPVEYDWIGENEHVIKRDFLPNDLASTLSLAKLDKCVAVQARQTDEETQWLLELADKNDIIAGVVGWIDLRADDLSAQLSQYKNNSKLKGFRHVLQGEPEPGFMLAPNFVRGLKTIEAHHYTYDLLIFAHQLPQAIELVKQFDSMPFVVDHIAKPKIIDHSDFLTWKDGLETLATFKNVYCKVSGMVTEADVKHWQPSDFERYLTVVFNAFGPDRIMFGSDWPVCLLGGEYQRIKQIVDDFVEINYPEHVAKIFGENAVKFYSL